MSDPARVVLIDYLLSHGWEQADSGPAGELWARGDTYTVVPRDIAVGTSPWIRLAGVLAQSQGESPDELLSLWRRLVSEARDVHEAGLPRERRTVGRVELEAHLDGPTVRDHETSAYFFGRFVMRTADAVKEVVKSTRGARHQSRELLVVGGPREGSVSVTFREPDRSDPQALVPDAPETIEGRALVLLAGILTAAERATDLTEADGLRSHLAPLNARARAGLAILADSVVDGGWVLAGTIRRGGEEADVRFGPHAARILGRTAREAIERETSESVAGVLDGWLWSASELVLIADDRGRIHVSVPLALQEQVAELNAGRGMRVTTMLNVVTRLAAGTSDRFTVSYSLERIRPEAPEPTFD